VAPFGRLAADLWRVRRPGVHLSCGAGFAWRPAREYLMAMNRGTGTGLIAFGVVLGLVGAIMAFAVTVRTHGFNINTAGWILLVVGILVLVIGIAILVTGSRRSSTTVENVQNTATGQERVEERRDWGTP
jgi:protein-S-isoprenylcysteine O-methyltransferase Ste14